jgi:aminoglycoside phosphotransferase (APT) family kinase protein
MLRSNRPARAATGVTHNDFCAENIVEDAAGALHVVDNGGLRPGFLDFDLARCRYRWPLTAPSWNTFIIGYRRWRTATTSREAERFWLAAALVRSAHFRVVRASPDVALPLRRLRRLGREER